MDTFHTLWFPAFFDIRRLLVREELPDRIDRKYKMDKEIRVR